MSAFEILIDRLKGGGTLKIEESFDPSFLQANEPELEFKTKVQVKGEAYLTDDHLVIHLQASTKVSMPCAICNEMIETDLKVENLYHTEPVEEIPSAIFNYSEALREALLIELPRTVECNQGKCPERAVIAPFLRPEAQVDQPTHFPFAKMDDLK